MKKFLLLFIGALSNIISFAQINILQNHSTSTDPNEYFINGISTRMDIGGVDINFVKSPTWVLSSGTPYGEGIKAIKLTNYNDFPVTVIVEYEYTIGNLLEKYVITSTLPPARGNFYPSKEVELNQPRNSNLKYWHEQPNIRSITRRVGAQN